MSGFCIKINAENYNKGMDKLNAKDFWNKRADHYDKSVNTTYADAYQKTIDLAREHIKPDDNILAFACGTGIVSNALAENAKKVTAIDISDQMVANAKQKADQENISNISYKVANLEDDEIQAGKYNVITAFNVLYFLKDLDKKLKLTYDMLPENGYFLSVTDCIPQRRSWKSFRMDILMKLKIVPYFRRMNPDDLTAYIEIAGFKIIRIENLHPEPPNLFVVAQKQ